MVMKKRSDMLGKLAMPKKPMADMEADQDLMMEDMGMEEDMPMEPEMEEEGEEMPEEGDLFADFSDDEIIEEMKKRGLSLEDEESEEDKEEDLLEMEDEEEMV